VNGNVFHEFPGAVVSGAVKGGGASDTLELGSAASAGTITGIGNQFIGFEVLGIDAGAVWSLTGANTLLSAASVDLGTSATLDVTGSLTAPANLTVNATGTIAAVGGYVEVGTAGTAAANQVAVDASHTLSISGGPAIAATLANAGAVIVTGGHVAINGPLTGAGTLQVDSADALALNGTASTAGSVLNDGTVTIGASDSLDVTGSINAASSGLFVLTNASLLEVAADTGGNNQISFLGTSGDKLLVDAVGSFGANVGLISYTGPTLENFGTANTIDLKNLLFSGATIDSYTASTGLLQLQSGSTKATLLFANATLGKGSFHLAADSGTGTLLTHS
jgi:hypothetical protein